ncbi:MAG TPA: methyltransferase [Pyrinomonadaceae bacterium]|nr:methyltransferase [Pyrinomonadaceae bacterium]
MPDYKVCYEKLIEKIDIDQKSLTNRELIEICQPEIQLFSLNSDPHLCHEIVEAAVNFLILTKYARFALFSDNCQETVRDLLEPLLMRLPTQTWRSTEQIKWQQFSTPPTIAFLLTYLLNLTKQKTILEPSAGTGNLAVWSRGIGSRTLTNEIDPRRRTLLTTLGFEPTAYNAENIHDYLSPETQIDCVMMNPPFSANGGRTKNSSKYGFRHVESALERLRKGGRFGVILGEAGGLDTKTGSEFWHKLLDRFEVRANLKLSGREYYKFGSAT